MRHVVVVGGGFGGLSVVKGLETEPVYVTVIDRNNHHLFQPLLYQVAMAGLSPADIAVPTRSVVSTQKNARVLMGDVTNIDLHNRTVELADGDRITYDHLVLAAGATTNYRGNDAFKRYALGLKDLDDAIEIRQRILLAFEAAERESDERARQRLLTFVVVGGGPTGVELAGALAELSRFVLARDFRHIQPGATRIILLEGGPRILSTFDPDLSKSAQRQLTDLGVDVRINSRIKQIDDRGVTVEDGHIEATTVIWAAGVRASPLADMLGVEQDRTGRVVVGRDCAIPSRPEVFVIGDMACHRDATGKPLPGVAPVAIQQGRSVAENIRRELRGEARRPFQYVDKGSMATIGRSRAVAERGKLKMTGLLAWIAWLVIHVAYLVGFRSRFVVMFEWIWSYFTYGRSGRLVTGRPLRRHVSDLVGVITKGADEQTVEQPAALPDMRAVQLTAPVLPLVQAAPRYAHGGPRAVPGHRRTG